MDGVQSLIDAGIAQFILLVLSCGGSFEPLLRKPLLGPTRPGTNQTSLMLEIWTRKLELQKTDGLISLSVSVHLLFGYIFQKSRFSCDTAHLTILSYFLTLMVLEGLRVVRGTLAERHNWAQDVI